MGEQDDKRNLVPRSDAGANQPPRRSVQLGRKESLDLSNLTNRDADAIEAEAHRRAIDRDDRQQLIGQDLSATHAQLRTYTQAVNETLSQNPNAAITITNTKDDSLGRTEVIIGNTDAAHKGKLSRSQQGLSDGARLWIILAIIAGVVVVLVAAFK